MTRLDDPAHRAAGEAAAEHSPRRELELTAVRFCLTCTGSLVPGFVHNMGNALVSTMGNYDLAMSSLTGSDLSSGLHSMKALGEAIERLGQLHNMLGQLPAEPYASPDSMPSSTWGGLLDLFRCFCGRALEFRTDSGSESVLAAAGAPGAMNGAVVLGLLSAAFHDLERKGRITLSASTGGKGDPLEIVITWSREEGGGLREEKSRITGFVSHLLTRSKALAESCGGRAEIPGPDRPGPPHRMRAAALLPASGPVVR